MAQDQKTPVSIAPSIVYLSLCLVYSSIAVQVVVRFCCAALAPSYIIARDASLDSVFD